MTGTELTHREAARGPLATLPVGPFLLVHDNELVTFDDLACLRAETSGHSYSEGGYLASSRQDHGMVTIHDPA